MGFHLLLEMWTKNSIKIWIVTGSLFQQEIYDCGKDQNDKK
jgi:hypothetical protein